MDAATDYRQVRVTCLRTTKVGPDAVIDESAPRGGGPQGWRRQQNGPVSARALELREIALKALRCARGSKPMTAHGGEKCGTTTA
jgi:hypothetical protein